MALINCPECGKEISDKALSCPNCGIPMVKQSITHPTIQPTFAPISDEKLLSCPKCQSTQLSTDKKGFSGGNALAGAILTGGVGLLAGTIGSGKIVITCLQCGYKYKAGEYENERYKFHQERERSNKIAKGEQSYDVVIFAFLVFSIIGFIISFKLFTSEWYFLGFIFSVATLLCVIMLVTGINSEIKRKPNDK